jgi:hypothetical protein
MYPVCVACLPPCCCTALAASGCATAAAEARSCESRSKVWVLTRSPDDLMSASRLLTRVACPPPAGRLSCCIHRRRRRRPPPPRPRQAGGGEPSEAAQLRPILLLGQAWLFFFSISITLSPLSLPLLVLLPPSPRCLVRLMVAQTYVEPSLAYTPLRLRSSSDLIGIL